jgi:ABC-type transport system involved in multi-copper enzyme maturation permease subunit
MKTFTPTYLLESKRLLKKKTIGLFLFLSLLSLYFVQVGLNNYTNIIGNRKEFQNIERMKVKQYINYGQYGSYGFRVLFIPSPLSIYFVNSSTISGLTANVDSGERLNIYNSFKGRALFADKGGGFKDFSGIMLLLGGLLVLYLGYESFIHRDYLRFMCGFTDYKRLFFSTILSRVFILVFLFLLNAGISLIILEINGIQFSGSEFAHFFTFLVTLVLVLIFFFALGTIAGSFKSGFAGFVMVIISWFVLVFLFPGIVNSITSRKADNLVSNYKLELQKLKSLMDFERESLEKYGDTTKDNIDKVRESVEDFLVKGFPKIHAFEERLRDEMEENIRYFEFLSSLFPSTFYLSAGNEISSKGYENFILFFDYIRELKKKFLRFYLDHRYYSDDPFDAPKTVESFIKDNENLFHPKSRTPRGFTRGVLLTLVYIIGLFIVSYSRFKQSLRL